MRDRPIRCANNPDFASRFGARPTKPDLLFAASRPRMTNPDLPRCPILAAMTVCFSGEIFGTMRMRVQNQMRVLRIVVAGLLIASTHFTVLSAAADDAEACANSSSDVAIAACTRAIDSGLYTPQNVATFHVSRGKEYAYKGEYDRAISDFDQAFRLDPEFARADRTNPVSVGAGQFICCRAILIDCRTRASWAIRTIGENAKHCAETCLRNLKC